MNMVLYGDSFLGRFGKDLIDQLEHELDNFTVYNCAAGGWNTSDLVNRAQYISRLRPEYVVLSFGANDVAPWKNVITLDVFADNVEKILSSFSGTKIIMLKCPDVDLHDKEQMNEFNSSLKTYYHSVENMFESVGVRVIETNILFEGLDEYHEDDGVHVNKLGYDKIIQKMSELVY